MGISKLMKYCIYSLPRYQGGFSIMVQTGNLSLATLSQWRRIFQESELAFKTLVDHFKKGIADTAANHFYFGVILNHKDSCHLF